LQSTCPTEPTLPQGGTAEQQGPSSQSDDMNFAASSRSSEKDCFVSAFFSIHERTIWRFVRATTIRYSSAGSLHVLSHNPLAVEQTPATKLSALGFLPCFVCLSRSGMAGKFQEFHGPSQDLSMQKKLGPFSAPILLPNIDASYVRSDSGSRTLVFRSPHVSR
jgi:hypothetical protein